MKRQIGIFFAVFMFAIHGTTLLAEESQDAQIQVLMDKIRQLENRIEQLEKLVPPKTGEPAAIYFTTQGADDKLVEKTQKPVIVEMSPTNDATAVDPKATELRVTFSVPMAKGFSWTGGGSDYPAGVKDKGAYWTNDQHTCIRPVRLEPNRQYRLGLNSPSHKNFQSAAGVPLEPVVYTFQTGE